jgi:enoyl-CoA hydratase
VPDANIPPAPDQRLTYSLEAGGQNATAVIRMDDGKVNALSHAQMDALSSALARAESEATALVLAGRSGRFCAGFDLSVMQSGAETATELVRHGMELLLQIYEATIPVVIACTGHAVAAGALLLLTGDRRIGASGAFKIGLNETSIGLPLPVLALALARDRLASPELVRATLMGQLYGPEEAVRAGYLDAVAPPEDLLAEATREAAKLGAFSGRAYAATKARLRRQTIAYVRETLDADMATLLQGGALPASSG